MMVSPGPQYTPVDIIEVSTGRVLTVEELGKDLVGMAVVFVGEVHTNPHHHAFQLEFLQALHDSGILAAVGMEMFPRESQPILDRWVHGDLSESEFLEMVDWQSVWGFPFSLYGPILNFVRRNEIPLRGLNAPQEIVRKVGDGGLDSLTATDRRRIAKEIKLDSQEHRDQISQRFIDHPRTSADFATFYQAQRVWDETMAETLTSTVENFAPTHQIVVVLTGNGHINNRLGIPDAFERRTQLPYAVIVPATPARADQLIENNTADYVRISLPTPPKNEHPRIGVVLDPKKLKEERLVAVDIVEDSIAEMIGLRAGDEIVKINGMNVKNPKDIHDALKLSEDFHHHVITVIREGKRLEKPFNLKIKAD